MTMEMPEGWKRLMMKNSDGVLMKTDKKAMFLYKDKDIWDVLDLMGEMAEALEEANAEGGLYCRRQIETVLKKFKEWK